MLRGVNKQIIEMIKPSLSINDLQNATKEILSSELIKIGLQKSVADYKNEIASELVNELKAELVDIIGHVIILYRQSKNKENRKITLPL